MEPKKALLTPRSLLLLAASALLFLAACKTMPQGNVEDGIRWFKLNRCIGCHGEGGTGGKAPPIASTSLSFRKFLSKLRAPHSSVMPTFQEERLSDQDAADIYSWLQEQKK